MISAVRAMSNFSNIIILVGVSGSGKSTIKSRLLDIHPDWRNLTSYTTRPPRPGEVPGQEYTFITQETFDAMRPGMLEKAEVYGHWYGRHEGPTNVLVISQRKGVMSISHEGARLMRRMYGEKFTKIIMLTLPEDIQRARLIARGTDSMDVIERRMAQRAEDEAHCQVIADKVIDNSGTIEETLKMVLEALYD